MNTSCTKFLVFVFCFISFAVNAQDKTSVLHDHEFALRHNFTKNYSTNFSLSSRAFAYKNEELDYNLRQVQLSHFSTFKLDLKHSIAFGIMYRNRNLFENSSNEIRLTQQFNVKSLLSTLRFGHRFRTEQRFYETFTAFRFRYRLALDFPLQGLKLDVGETYFVISNEALLTNSSINKPEIDYRLSPSLGLQLTEKLTLEFGLELRLEALNIETSESLFLNTSVEIRI
ncbi:DUF2490 domain-containing protein [Psychroserpens sp. Hel_I_66]|uniref:DUF2490 domain-containing protein n=1 Tax=Psychroserpens sp. Hel_I_66 TaxID=1250004 RepID=UPI000648EF89|nr:DUF2490 domain-containing protein [Psychroserpens sp. Hel_I_66]